MRGNTRLVDGFIREEEACQKAQRACDAYTCDQQAGRSSPEVVLQGCSDAEEQLGGEKRTVSSELINGCSFCTSGVSALHLQGWWPQ